MSEQVPWLVVGLGNPGARYAQNRHNVGFMAVEALRARESPPPSWSEKHKGLVATLRVDGQRCVLLRPMTFMNRSGASVVAAATFYRTPPAQILVVHDEIDFPFGRLAVKMGGGHGGHNGLRDIIQAMGSRDFPRIRLGVGRPTRGEVSDYVLADFGPEDAAELPDLLDRACAAAITTLTQGVSVAMNRHNERHTGGQEPAS